jgi:hypothetical protein
LENALYCCRFLGSHSICYEKFYPLGYSAVYSVQNETKFLAEFISTLKTEASCSSETTFDFKPSTRRYIPENRTLCLCSSRFS